MIKLIATDLDGTLMSTDHLTVSPRTVDALKKAHIKGVKIAIATGRPLALVDNVISQVPFVDYVIYSNGACVYDLQSKKVIYSNLIPNKDSVGLINFFLENKVFFEIYVEGKSYYQLGTEELFVKVAFPQEFVDEVAKTMTGCENLVEFLGDSDVEKITLYSVKNEDFEKFKKEFLLYNMSVASSFVGNLEATVGTADKGEAVKGICDVMGITADNCMTFGDAGNDTPMLKFAKYSFAMANGTDECKASAKHIAKSNGEDGLAIAVEEYVLGEK